MAHYPDEASLKSEIIRNPLFIEYKNNLSSQSQQAPSYIQNQTDDTEGQVLDDDTVIKSLLT